MSEPWVNPSRPTPPAGESEEQFLDDLAAGHLDELSRRSTADKPTDSATPDPRAAKEQPQPTPERQTVGEDVEHCSDVAGTPQTPATGTDEQQEESAATEATDRPDPQAQGAVDKLLSAVERFAERNPPRRPRSSALFGPARVRHRPSRKGRFRARMPDLRLPPYIRAIALQAAAVAAGAAGTAILAWLMFG